MVVKLFAVNYRLLFVRFNFKFSHCHSIPVCPLFCFTYCFRFISMGYLFHWSPCFGECCTHVQVSPELGCEKTGCRQQGVPHIRDANVPILRLLIATETMSVRVSSRQLLDHLKLSKETYPTL